MGSVAKSANKAYRETKDFEKELPLYNLYQVMHELEKAGYRYKIKGTVGLNPKNRDVEKIIFNKHTDEIEVLQNLISLTNFNSPLPHSDLENFLFLVKDKNFALQNLLDIFNNRLAQLFFKANKNISVQHCVNEESRYRKFLKNMIYTSSSNDIDQVFLVNFCWPSLGSLNDIDRYIRYKLHQFIIDLNQNSTFLNRLKLSRSVFFRIEVKNLFGRWTSVSEKQIQLGRGYKSNSLNNDSILGEKIFTAIAGMEIKIDCFDLNLYNALLPGESLSTDIISMLKEYCTYSTKILLNLSYYEQENGIFVEGTGLRSLNTLGYNSILGRVSMNLESSKLY